LWTGGSAPLVWHPQDKSGALPPVHELFKRPSYYSYVSVWSICISFYSVWGMCQQLGDKKDGKTAKDFRYIHRMSLYQSFQPKFALVNFLPLKRVKIDNLRTSTVLI
jgi:hypothetical protein